MLKRLAQTAVVVGASAAVMGGGAVAANADPSYDAGCASYSYNIPKSGWDAWMETSGTFSIQACWSGGSFSQNKITMQNSNVTTTDGITDSVESVSDPSDAAGIPYSNGQVIGSAGSADAYWTVNISSGVAPVIRHVQCQVSVHLEPGSATFGGTCG